MVGKLASGDSRLTSSHFNNSSRKRNFCVLKACILTNPGKALSGSSWLMHLSSGQLSWLQWKAHLWFRVSYSILEEQNKNMGWCSFLSMGREGCPLFDWVLHGLKNHFPRLHSSDVQAQHTRSPLCFLFLLYHIVVAQLKSWGAVASFQ